MKTCGLWLQQIFGGLRTTASGSVIIVEDDLIGASELNYMVERMDLVSSVLVSLEGILVERPGRIFVSLRCIRGEQRKMGATGESTGVGGLLVVILFVCFCVSDEVLVLHYGKEGFCSDGFILNVEVRV